jgi:hypothetical protein
MLTYLRYTLATVCFAASVGCLALWWRSKTDGHLLEAVQFHGDEFVITLLKTDGLGFITLPDRENDSTPSRGWQHRVAQLSGARVAVSEDLIREQGTFGATGRTIYFPLWYPALILALAGVAALRLGRRFTLSSAIVVTTVAAGLLGMAVIL